MFGKIEFNHNGDRFVQTVLGSSVRGASHTRSGTPCQDHGNFLICDDGTLIMAVADGHGSKSSPYSASGALIAVNVFLRTLKEIKAEYADKPDQLMTYLNREGSMKIAQTIEAEWKRRIIKSHQRSKRSMKSSVVKNNSEFTITSLYGTTLLGLMIDPEFLFAYQLGDGDICYVDDKGIEMVIQPEKILGVETHSMSKPGSWKKVNTVIRRRDVALSVPSVLILSTDGFSNSHRSEAEYQKSCIDYFSMITEHGPKSIETNLSAWLEETSELGCGDDITLMFAYTNKVDSSEDRTKLK